MEIKVELEKQEKFEDIYRIYTVRGDLKEIFLRLWEENAVIGIHEENEASLMDDMIEDGKELFKRLIRELEQNEGLAQARLLVSSKGRISLIVKIDAYITWRILLDRKKVEVVEG
ncbi:hypothetical protein [Palaeococcus sp. (in: euryarchaeotes)]